jgi:hypothetical protein
MSRLRWEHLTEISDPVRLSLGQIFAPWDQRDLQVDSALELLVEDQHAREQISRVLRSSENRGRIPVLCTQLMGRHPEISNRQAFRAVGLFLGLHPRWIQKLFYRSRPCSKCD